MHRRTFLKYSVLGGSAAFTPASLPILAAPGAPAASSPGVKPFDLDEKTIAELQTDMDAGQSSAVSQTQKYLERIEAIDRSGPALRAVIELNPDALAIAAALDQERKQKGARGPLHGIPVLIKDNIDTHDRMSTTAGSLALEGSIAPQDAFLVSRLREAGAVILGKTNLSEWANFRSTRSTSGWSARGGQTRNPYALDRDPSGSSSGSAAAVAANLCAVAVGTETDGSILSPATVNGIVGIKPTVGLISRSGIIPISHTQDTAGPMARTVADAAVLLTALAGADPRDRAASSASRRAPSNYRDCLERDGLRGARLGIMRGMFRNFHPAALSMMERLFKNMSAAGAELIDDIGWTQPRELGQAEGEVLHYEFKHGLNAYLASLGPNAPVRTLEDVIRFNETHREREMPWFGQEIFLNAQAKGPLTDRAYREALAACDQLARRDGIDAIMDRHKLDALVTPTSGPAAVIDYLYRGRDTGYTTWAAAVSGYPSITVPAGQILGMPIGMSFIGRAWSEPTLLRIAYGFEQQTQARRPPRFLPTIEPGGQP